MYRVMVVEDEVIVRDWLKKRVGWADCGLTVCAEAANGQEALLLYERERPDIILTDIRIPMMDGITLLSKVRQQDKRVRFLILTCLDEFALVQQSVQLEVTSYILKLTSEPEEIERELQRARDWLIEYDGNVKPEPEKNKEIPNRRFTAAISYLEEHYADNVSLLQVAEAVGVTPGYLGKMFLKYHGSTFTDELNRIRIREAKRRMADVSCRIYEVAEQVGFANISYFFRVFKKYEGCTPREYYERIGRK